MCSVTQGAALKGSATEKNVSGTTEGNDLALDGVLKEEEESDDESDDESNESPLTSDDAEEELARQLEEANEIEPEIRPTKKTPQAHIRNSAAHAHRHPTETGLMPYYAPMTYAAPAPMPYAAPAPMPYAAPAPMPYGAPAPLPYAMPYSQCPFSQPLYYPQPMYPPYQYAPHNPVLKAAIDPTDTTEVVNIDQLLKIANFWSKQNVTKVYNKNETTKGRKRFGIRNWIKNKANRFTTAKPTE
ncbi:hypothetical protein AWZ03_005381 [Drosophila navojoa]|uniref:Uncharacterized protein n=1 Tax=Drosophila navojoa TaxID=7232 RepID=A0A484BH63_DRONA|nr:hypothetical protein AWZ03_005381 [Drosophila navojoa]